MIALDNARRDDPGTSKAAAIGANRHYRIRHRDIVLAAVQDNPGLTTAELANRCSLNYHQIARRMHELIPGHVERSGVRKCLITGTPHHTYIARKQSTENE